MKTALFFCNWIAAIFLSASGPAFAFDGPTAAKLSALPPLSAQVADHRVLAWGICGHPTWPDYADWVPGNMAKQIAYVRELGCTYYRCSFEGASYPAILDIVVPPAQAEGVTVLPILPLKITPKNSPDATYTANYQNALSWANYAISKGYNLPYWELGNELENNSYVSVSGDGTSPDQFKDKTPGGFVAIASSLKGAYQGIKDAYRIAKTQGSTTITPQVLFGCTYRHWGLLAKIRDYNHSMPCDILSWHWYAPAYGSFTTPINNMFSSGYNRTPAECLADFKSNDDPQRSMDIWITETNRSVKLGSGAYLNGSYSDNASGQDWAAEAEVLQSTIDDLKKADHVKAIIVYELFDEPNAHGKSAKSRSGEGYLGLATGLNGQRKDAFYTYQKLVKGSP